MQQPTTRIPPEQAPAPDEDGIFQAESAAEHPAAPVTVSPVIASQHASAAVGGPTSRRGVLGSSVFGSGVLGKRSMLGMFWAIGAALEWLFGLVSLIAALALLAAIPVVNLLSLGYLLNAGGRVAQSGRLRDGLVGIDKAARVGSMVVGAWLLLLPVRFVASLHESSWLIDPTSESTWNLRLGAIALGGVVVAHILWAWWRGGRFRHFLWPAPVRFVRRMLSGGKFVEARDDVWRFVVGLRLPYYFWLGLRGFVGTSLWLAVPVSLLVVARGLPEGWSILVGIIGGLLLGMLVMLLPFAQVQFAKSGKTGDLFAMRNVRLAYKRAPIAFAFALLVTVATALPLYLLKIELIPREVTWLPTLLFVLFILPARLLAGWAVGRADRRTENRHWLFRVSGRLAIVPIAVIYVAVVYFSQYTAWDGVWGLYQQHALLVPTPF